MNSIEPNYIKRINHYILTNLKDLELVKFKKICKYLGYKSSFEYLNILTKETIELKIETLKDNFIQTDFMKRYINLGSSDHYSFYKLYKRRYIDRNSDIFTIIGIMMYNFNKVEFGKDNLEEHKKLLITQIKSSDYFDVRYKRLRKNKSEIELSGIQFYKKELDEIEKKLLHIRQIEEPIHQFIFLNSESKLHSLCLELKNLGYIFEVDTFIDFFTRRKIPGKIKSNKISWNSDLISLIYLFHILIIHGFIDQRSLKNLNKNLSFLFLYNGRAKFSNKQIGDRLSYFKKNNSDFLKKRPSHEYQNLLNVYELVIKIKKDK